MGTQPEVTTVTEKNFVKNVDEYPNQMASVGVATTRANAYNVSKFRGVVEQYEDKMEQMKVTLRKE